MEENILAELTVVAKKVAIKATFVECNPLTDSLDDGAARRSHARIHH